jgi:hypothetical protein
MHPQGADVVGVGVGEGVGTGVLKQCAGRPALPGALHLRPQAIMQAVGDFWDSHLFMKKQASTLHLGQ